MDRILDKCQDALAQLANFYESVCIALLAAMLSINALNIVTRGVFDISLNWVWPWTMVAFLTWVMLAFFPLYQRRKDVSIYILLQHISPMAQRGLGVFVSLAIMAASGLLIYTFPERLASLRGTIEIVGLSRKVLIWPLLASALPMFIGAALDVLRLMRGADYQPFGMIDVSEASQ